jgi:hypothetical protein
MYQEQDVRRQDRLGKTGEAIDDCLESVTLADLCDKEIKR